MISPGKRVKLIEARGALGTVLPLTPVKAHLPVSKLEPTTL
jgi:hypothetical protein